MTSVLDLQSRNLIERFFVSKTPSAPVRLWSVASADLPPAAEWTACQVYVADKTCVGVSNGTTWTRSDGSAL